MGSSDHTVEHVPTVFHCVCLEIWPRELGSTSAQNQYGMLNNNENTVLRTSY